GCAQGAGRRGAGLGAAAGSPARSKFGCSRAVHAIGSANDESAVVAAAGACVLYLSRSELLASVASAWRDGRGAFGAAQSCRGVAPLRSLARAVCLVGQRGYLVLVRTGPRGAFLARRAPRAGARATHPRVAVSGGPGGMSGQSALCLRVSASAGT